MRGASRRAPIWVAQTGERSRMVRYSARARPLSSERSNPTRMLVAATGPNLAPGGTAYRRLHPARSASLPVPARLPSRLRGNRLATPTLAIGLKLKNWASGRSGVSHRRGGAAGNSPANHAIAVYGCNNVGDTHLGLLGP